MLDENTLCAIERYFAEHPVLTKYLQRVSVCLTGSCALGLGGVGADIDLKVIAPQVEFEKIRQGLISTGRIAASDEPEEELTGLVGDYCLEPLERVQEAVRDYHDLTQVFVYGHLVHILGNRDVAHDVIAHCRTIPEEVLQQERVQEEGRLSEAIYAFLRSFQTADEVGRLLSRANVIRCAMRLAFLAESEAPPYDKHLFRSLPSLKCGPSLAVSVRRFLQQDGEEGSYRQVAHSTDWHEMYRCAEGTPVMKFRTEVQTLLQLTT